jgi:hypothetical protein
MARNTSRSQTGADAEGTELSISPEKVCFIIIKAREFDAKEAVSDPDSGSNPADDKDIDVLEDRGGDPVAEELTSFIDAMSVDEQVDLVALAWLGRDADTTAADWPAMREEAASAHNNRTARYLLGMPTLGDVLEEGLSMLGHSCQDYETGRL